MVTEPLSPLRAKLNFLKEIGLFHFKECRGQPSSKWIKMKRPEIANAILSFIVRCSDGGNIENNPSFSAQIKP